MYWSSCGLGVFWRPCESPSRVRSSCWPGLLLRMRVQGEEDLGRKDRPLIPITKPSASTMETASLMSNHQTCSSLTLISLARWSCDQTILPICSILVVRVLTPYPCGDSLLNPLTMHVLPRVVIHLFSAGFPTRKASLLFLERYAILLPRGSLARASDPEISNEDVGLLCRELLQGLGLDGWQIGKQRVFLRAGQLAHVEVWPH